MNVRREMAMAMNDLKVANYLRERKAWGMVHRREFYRPNPEKNRNVKQVETPPELGLEIWSYEDLNGTLYGVAFQGNAQKPLWHYRFRNLEQLERQVNETVKSRSQSLEYKQQRQNERTQFQHTLKEGDILVSSWGYDQTNIDFYEVVGVLPKAVVIREIASRIDHEERGAEYVVPVPGKYTGPAMRKLVRQGNSVRIESYASASLWDGRPRYQTAAGYGH